MPWSASDAHRHKHGLSASQSEKWATIANSALKYCEEKGNGNCEAYAIRVANSRTKTSLKELVLDCKACGGGPHRKKKKE